MKKGKYIFICMGKDCRKAGAARIKKLTSVSARNFPKDEKWKVIKTDCMDECKHGPNIIFKNRLYKNVCEEKVEDLFTKYGVKQRDEII